MGAVAVAPFPPPPHGWTCFHCGESFRTVAEGTVHFGTSPNTEAGCQIKRGDERKLLLRLRQVEQERDELYVRLTSWRLGLDKEGESDAIERWRATRPASLP